MGVPFLGAPGNSLEKLTEICVFFLWNVKVGSVFFDTTKIEKAQWEPTFPSFFGVITHILRA